MHRCDAADDVNVQDLFIVGREVVKQMEGQPVFEYSYRRKNKVKTLASARSIEVTVGRVIDPALLFQRFLVVSQLYFICYVMPCYITLCYVDLPYLDIFRLHRFFCKHTVYKNIQAQNS